MTLNINVLTPGVDTVVGNGGDDVLNMAPDTLTPGDSFDGGAGNDALWANFGASGVYNFTGVTLTNVEIIIGSNGEDTFILDQSILAGVPRIDGGDGYDTVKMAAAGTLDYSGVTLSNIELIAGTSGADTIVGTNGNDTIAGLGGADVINGGAGTDTADYSTSGAAVTVNLATGVGAGGDAAGDTLISIENLTGSAHNDTLIGSAGDNILIGGAGADTLTGGAGADVFWGSVAELNGDTITDLSFGDRIFISDAFGSGLAGYTGFSLSGSTLTISGSSGTGTLTVNLQHGYHLVAGPGNKFVPGISLSLAANPWIDNGLSGDFNGDGKSDLLWRSDSGQFSDWLGLASGGFANNDANALITISNDWRVVGAGDFNGDGRDDVVWRSSNAQVSDWLGQANGGFTINDTYAFNNVTNDWQVAGVGDFNGDGRDDLLWRSDAGLMSDWLGQANGGFLNNDANVLRGVSTAWHIVGVGDFNGDHRDDILWRSDSGQLSDWLGQANGGFIANDAVALTTVLTDWHVVGVGDFNGDGRSDILWRSEAGQVSDWLGQANGGFVANDANAFTSYWSGLTISAVGDFNGDGRDDIVARDSAGTTRIWQARPDGGFTSYDSFSASVPTSWHIQVDSLFAI